MVGGLWWLQFPQKILRSPSHLGLKLLVHLRLHKKGVHLGLATICALCETPKPKFLDPLMTGTIKFT